MARSGDRYGFKLPNDRSELTPDEKFWLEVLRDLYAGRVRSPRMIDIQVLREVLWRDRGSS